MENKRITSVKTKIKPIIEGKYIVQEGFNPNYIVTNKGMRLSRVRIMATIVDKFISEDKKFGSITVDDATETIRAKVFNAVSMFDDLEVGDIADIVGRVREYQGEIYIMPEVVKKAEDPNWEILRELEIRELEKEWEEKRSTIQELKNQTSDMSELKKIAMERYNIEDEDVESIVQSSEVSEEKEENDINETVLKLIIECDDGSGCDYTVLIEKSGLEEEIIDSVINEFLTDGICFEPRPGKIKKL